MKTINQLRKEPQGSYILPFLWMKGEDNDVIGKELERIHECGIKEICLESRPHPDFLGEQWWENLDFIMAEAKKRGMRVWVLDDDKFPTGHCHGAFEQKYPERKKTYLAERHVDIMGPCQHSAMLVKNFLGTDGRLLGIFAFAKPDTGTRNVVEEGCIDLTGAYEEGFVYFNLPEGAYRLFILFTTQQGGGRDSYLNLIDTGSVRTLLDEVYEPHFARYGAEFGTTFAGFFSDEPELGNEPGYPFDAQIGMANRKLPWSGELEQELRERWGLDFLKNLVSLWYETGVHAAERRYAYMDSMTVLVHKCFSGQVGGWCRAHGVEYIGHVIEDDNAHARLGCSVGHYFREMRGQDMAGIDVVHHQIVPGFTGRVHQWIAGDSDGEFFHFGLAKLAASEARLDEKKRGRALCEIFGNYGWAEGVTFMKWLTNHMLVRGINHFTPHAFSMKYPDTDCPPHFYAGGNNPQFACFTYLMKYMNRMSHFLSNGTPVVNAAVLYHGEAEWCSGDAMLFQKPVRALMEQQLDCDVVTLDYLKAAVLGKGSMAIGNRSYPVLLIPYTKILLPELVKFLQRAKAAAFPVVFIENLPRELADGSRVPEVVTQGCAVSTLPELPEMVRRLSPPVFSVRPAIFVRAAEEARQKKVSGEGAACRSACGQEHMKNLRTLLVRQQDGYVLMCFNEDVAERLTFQVQLTGMTVGKYIEVDAWMNRERSMRAARPGIFVSLEAGEAKLFLIPEGTEPGDAASERAEPACEETLALDWRVTAQNHDKTRKPQTCMLTAAEGLCNMNGPGRDIHFSGTFHYQTEFVAKKEETRNYALTIPKAGDTIRVLLNGTDCGCYAGFPATVDITQALTAGKNELEIEVANTLVWELMDGASTHLQLYPTGLLEQPILKNWRKEER